MAGSSRSTGRDESVCDVVRCVTACERVRGCAWCRGGAVRAYTTVSCHVVGVVTVVTTAQLSQGSDIVSLALCNPVLPVN
jgi:hypothetical protein